MILNLVDGHIIDTKSCDAVLENLEQRIVSTLKKGRLDTETVITACSQLVGHLDDAIYLQTMADLGIDESLGRQYLDEARLMFGETALRCRLQTELGADDHQTRRYMPLYQDKPVTEQLAPLGVLLHVAAGNAEGLPAFSVLEGLLTGNINILKLPAAEGGISVRILLELIKVAPSLAEYIYVFDYSSRDIQHIGKLVAAADAVVVWGGAEAVTALRRLVGPNTRLIEWGHKVSFAYVTEPGLAENLVENRRRDLANLACHMVETGQLLCSSCQGIYLDTDDMDVLYRFCRDFLPILEATVEEKGQAARLGIGIETQIALQVYNEELESQYQDSRVFKGKHCSLIAYADHDLKPGIQFGNAWVKRLPKAELLATLRPYKNFLQTAGLICGESERSELTGLLWQTGLVRVCLPDRMSATYCGAPHDGEYPLRKYMKIVSSEL